MRNIFLTFMLAIVSSVWMMSEAASCITQAPDNLQPSYITVSGTIQSLGYPCDEGEDCPDCMTWAIVTSDKTYYLSIANRQVQEFLDHMEMAPIPAIYQLPLQARASGISFTKGSFDFLVINDINDLYVQYFSDQLVYRNSLCDKWNVMGISMIDGKNHFHTFIQRLTTDTIIGGIKYTRLQQSDAYMGAMREGTNRDIYYIPNGTAKEYLLCAFNAQAGDTLYNMWVGGHFSEEHNGKRAVVREIQATSPKIFVVDYEYTYNEGADTIWWGYHWIEGVGLTCAPSGQWCPFDCEGDYGEVVLCAYKNGEQVYVSEWGEKYGCEYNYDPFSTPADTIPLYAQDDPGSSTVDPVDPNQVVATLKGDELTIHEYTGVDVTYSLQRNAPAEAPSRNKAPQADTFRDEVTIQITGAGKYLLQLTNPSWGYTIFGQFYYGSQGIEQIPSSTQGAETSRLVLMNDQIYILRGEKVYTLQGQKMR